jgi:enoyl-CoA hydratase/carnithine racemase
VSTSESSVLYTVSDDCVGVLTLNRPDRLNALTPVMQQELFAATRCADQDSGVRAVVLTGSGRGFCAGADIDLLQRVGQGTAGADERLTRPSELLRLRKPLIAAINGPCAGIGLVLALFCDIRFAATDAKITTAFAQRGLVAEHGLSWLLPRIVGHSRALDLLLSARIVLGDEAERMGLVDRAVAREDVLSEAMAYARAVAATSAPNSTAAIKGQIYRHADCSLDEALDDSDELMRISLEGADFVEGVASYLEKRPPAFAALPANERAVPRP